MRISAGESWGRSRKCGHRPLYNIKISYSSISPLTYSEKIIQYWEAVKFMEKNGSFPNSSLFHFSNFYLFLRERKKQNVSRGEAERGRHRIWSRLQALSCQHRVPRGARTHEIRDRDLSQSRTLNQLSHPGAPSPTFKELTGQLGTREESKRQAGLSGTVFLVLPCADGGQWLQSGAA